MRTMKEERPELKPFGKTGACELCGRHNTELHVLVLHDWIGWACDECRDEMQKCFLRQIQAAAWHTEPAE